MRINEFVELYKENTSAAIDELNIKPYLGIGKKYLIAQSVVDASCYTDDNDVLITDSFNQYMLLVYKTLIEYTDLEIETNEIFKAYDELAECGALYEILGVLDREITLIDNLSHGYLRDKISYENSSAKIINTCVDAVLSSIEDINLGITEAISGIDTSKIVGLIDKLK